MQSAAAPLPRLAVTAGEPAGIGAELVVRLAQQPLQADLVALADADQLQRTAANCGVNLELVEDDGTPLAQRGPGQLRVRHHPLAIRETAGSPDPRNAGQVLAVLEHAVDACLRGDLDALVTGPVQKSVINEAGHSFTGHTEFLARRTHSSVVMLLASEEAPGRPPLRVALATTHLPLRLVPDALNIELLRETLGIVAHALEERFAIEHPILAVLGLNPHAGEGGHLGREEIEIIQPALDSLRAEGLDLIGPLPADTAFVPEQRRRYDAVLAMYHDQALPVLKSEAFERTVNITLGLPFVRTSVDHGTALDLAGTGRADPSSMFAAARMALRLVAAGRRNDTR